MSSEVNHRDLEEDVIRDKVPLLIKHRIPWLILGLIGGMYATVFVSSFETLLQNDIRLAFFIPIIVYLSGAVATQIQTIYVRELSERKNIQVGKYIVKEIAVGAGLGLLTGCVVGLFTYLWLSSQTISIIISLTIFINFTIAPLIAVFIPSALHKKNSDPALGAGPIMAILLDIFSLSVFFLIASLLI